MKKNKQNVNAVTYVKLKEHEVAFMKHRYGVPLQFGQSTKYYKVLKRYCKCNKALKCQYTRMSFSDFAYRLAQAEKNRQLNMWDKAAVPTEEELNQLVPVLLPVEVVEQYSNDDKPSVNNIVYVQLDKRGAEKFRELATEDFWVELSMWERSQRKECALDGVKDNRRDMILDFFDEHGISFEHLENIYRHYDRNKDKLR